MQSEIFQALNYYNYYNFDDYVLQLMKTSQYSNFEFGVFTSSGP